MSLWDFLNKSENLLAWNELIVGLGRPKVATPISLKKWETIQGHMSLYVF